MGSCSEDAWLTTPTSDRNAQVKPRDLRAHKVTQLFTFTISPPLTDVMVSDKHSIEFEMN